MIKRIESKAQGERENLGRAGTVSQQHQRDEQIAWEKRKEVAATAIYMDRTFSTSLFILGPRINEFVSIHPPMPYGPLQNTHGRGPFLADKLYIVSQCGAKARMWAYSRYLHRRFWRFLERIQFAKYFIAS
jgi:hypothetical protein